MASEVKARVRMLLMGGSATPAPPVGSVLGALGINIMDFCKQFNARTATMKGQTVPVDIVVYKDKKFDFVTKTAPATELLKKKAGITKGATNPKAETVGKVTWKDVEEIAKIKLPDLNTVDIEQAKKIIAGSARSIGIQVI